MKQCDQPTPAWLAALLVTFILSSEPVAAQARTDRACSADDVRQALAGDYAGPPCRFTEMPGDVDAGTWRATAPQLAGAPPEFQLQDGESRLDPMQVRMPVSGRDFPLAAQRPPQPSHVASSAADGTVRLGPDFFSGGLVGGVGQVPTIQYGYRGLIVIDGAGRTSLLPPGQLTGAPVMRMQARSALRTQLVGQ